MLWQVNTADLGYIVLTLHVRSNVPGDSAEHTESDVEQVFTIFYEAVGIVI